MIEIYSMWIMWEFQNLDALYSLITAVITESISFAVYAAKSYNETKQSELICLEREKMNTAMTAGDAAKTAAESNEEAKG
ncbi:MAG: hypothetical protein LUD77_09090 [Clostridiales bacterium]|nr:hypothetical protein [Clostridiales bacterium]